MLDSPYVRRCAVSLKLMGVPFEHEPVSVFRHLDRFRAINPVVKAPTLVCDDGTVLMDSTLILDHVETLVAPAKRLMPIEPAARREALRLTGLALAACEKGVQIVYERELRPADKRHQPWLDRVTGQLHAACQKLDDTVGRHPFAAPLGRLDQAGVSTAVAWHFIQSMLPDVVEAEAFPALSAWTDQAEQTPAFLAAPHGEGLVQKNA